MKHAGMGLVLLTASGIAGAQGILAPLSLEDAARVSKLYDGRFTTEQIMKYAGQGDWIAQGSAGGRLRDLLACYEDAATMASTTKRAAITAIRAYEIADRASGSEDGERALSIASNLASRIPAAANDTGSVAAGCDISRSELEAEIKAANK